MRSPVAYLADIFEKFNEVNLSLQGVDNNLIKSKSAVPGFIAILSLYQRELGRMDFGRFPRLNEVRDCISDDTLMTFTSHLSNVQDDMNERFSDLLGLLLVIPEWIINPFEFTSHSKLRRNVKLSPEY